MASIFWNIFGFGKKATPVATTDESIQKLRETEEILVKKQEFLEKRIETEVASARKHGTKNKREALRALKRKKQFEKQLQHIDGVLSTMEMQREALENAATNTEVLRVIGDASKTLQKAHNEFDVDKVHDMMEEIAEQRDVADEIAEAISNPAGLGLNVDEDELLKELEDLEQEKLDEDLLSSARLPAVADVRLPATSRKPLTEATKDDEMGELEAWAAA